MDGTRLIVGAPNDDGEGNSTSNVGKVYTFALEDGAQTALNKVNIIGDSHFGDGTALSLDGDTLIVGAPGADGFGPATSGSGEVFRFTFAGDDYRGVELSVLTHAMSAW